MNILNLIKNIYQKLSHFKFIRNLKTFLISIFYQYHKFTYTSIFKKDAFPNGLNIIGLIKGQMGLGESVRLLIKGASHTNLDVSLIDFDYIDYINRDDMTYINKISNKFIYNINIFHLNPPELLFSLFYYGKKVFHKRYNIGFWLWEFQELPKEWEKAFYLVDEIWTPSKFITETLSQYTDKPIKTFHYPIQVNVKQDLDRKYFTLKDDHFIFITLFDFNSSMERKNVFASIKAFNESFRLTDSVSLVIKMNHTKEEDLKKLEEFTLNNPNIILMTDVLSRIEVNSLIDCCDALISLHRCEGFGLTLAEAMYLGKPTIATNYSANTEFMNAENSCLV